MKKDIIPWSVIIDEHNKNDGNVQTYAESSPSMIMCLCCPFISFACAVMT